jgi:hypothetical protein
MLIAFIGGLALRGKNGEFGGISDLSTLVLDLFETASA